MAKRLLLIAVTLGLVFTLSTTGYTEDGKLCDRYAKQAMKQKMMHHKKKGYLFYGAMAKLNLSPRQKAELAKLKLAYKRDRIKVESKIKLLELDLKELVLSDKLDLDSIRAKLEQIEKLRTELRLGRYRALKDFMAILTPKQRKEFKEKLLYGLVK